MKTCLIQKHPCAALLILSFFGLALFSGCGTTLPEGLDCIVLPPTNINIDRNKTVKVASKLEKLPLDASLEAGFNNSIKADYPDLTKASSVDYTTALYLQAIDCYIRRATKIKDPDVKRTVLDVIRKLSETVVGKYAEVKVAGKAGPMVISGQLKAAIDHSEQKATFYNVLTPLGWRLID